MSALSLFLPGATVSGHIDALSSQTPNKQRSLPFHRGRCCVCGGPELLMTPHRDTCEANKASAHKEHPAWLKSTVSNGATVLGTPNFMACGCRSIGTERYLLSRAGHQKAPTSARALQPSPQERRGFGLHPLCFQVFLHFNQAQPREMVHPGEETKLMDAHGTGHRLQSCGLHAYTRVWGVRVFVLGALSWLLHHRFFQLRDSVWC